MLSVYDCSSQESDSLCSTRAWLIFGSNAFSLTIRRTAGCEYPTINYNNDSTQTQINAHLNPQPFHNGKTPSHHPQQLNQPMLNRLTTACTSTIPPRLKALQTQEIEPATDVGSDAAVFLELMRIEPILVVRLPSAPVLAHSILLGNHLLRKLDLALVLADVERQPAARMPCDVAVHDLRERAESALLLRARKAGHEISLESRYCQEVPRSSDDCT